MVKAEIENCSKEQLLASTETKKETTEATSESTLNDTEKTAETDVTSLESVIKIIYQWK